MIKYIAIILTASTVLVSCSPRLEPITEDLIEEYNFDDRALKNIQYYLSSDIVLYRSLSDGESIIENGRVTLKNGKKVEEIVFRAGTPGVYVFSPKDNTLAISFEEGKGKYLIFGPIKDRRGHYRLLAKQWNKNYGIVNYDGQAYRTPAASAYAELVIDLKAQNQVVRKKKEVSGRTVN
ncbi:hypothetical protein [Membranihabitans marinus]|uniref:hypothetical protein n=1 Tax=Membranihabitans marinus TaxID=1227546 RepID=UPI001F3D47E1|nr:hypothetical protein [Membranihabitans marinus]